jgi:hypothetical protein
MREMKGLDGSNPPPSANQSTIFAFSAENTKIVRMFAHFLRPEGSEKPRFGRQELIYARFSLWRTEPVPLRTSDACWLRPGFCQ